MKTMESFEDLQTFVTDLGVSDGLSEQQIAVLLRSLAAVQLPEYTYRAELITINSAGGGMSRKPGNIVLNWRRFFDLMPDVGVAAVDLIGKNGFVTTLVALYVWNKLWRGSEAKLTDAEASVIEALWRNKGSVRTVPSDRAFALTNDLRQTMSVAPLSRSEFERATDLLVAMHCVQVTNDEIWLREWVRKRT